MLRLHILLTDGNDDVQRLHMLELLLNVRLTRQNVNVKELHVDVPARN